MGVVAGGVSLYAQGRPGPEGGQRGFGPSGPGGPGGMRRNIPVMAALDADKDGVISAKEIANATAALKTLDKNKDGQLTPDELRPPRPEGAPPRGQGRGQPGGPGGGGDIDAIADRIMAFDTSGDGKLTVSELPERMQGLLRAADGNGDGVLTRDEVVTGLERRGGPGGRGNRQGERGGRPDRPAY